jgi:hypothetical protein
VNRSLVDGIAAAVLYEGYLLYPYRRSALKNQQRFNFGVVVPRREAQAGEGGWFIHAECLVRAAGESELDVRVRFLHLTSKTGRSAWQEAIEREIPVNARLDGLCVAPVKSSFHWPAEQDTRESLHGEVELSARRVAEGLFKVGVHVANATPVPDAHDTAHDALLQYSLISTHAILHVANGEFVSLLDPPVEVQAFATGCRNIGVWPVLVGEETDRDAVLASPIILYDHPQIAPESAGDFFDATEIDEMLVLRILTMTDEEKREVREGDLRGRRMLERTEGLSDDDMMKLHGVLRALQPAHDEARDE